MVKRYCDKCGQQIDDGVHSWYIVELHGTDGELRHKEMCEECYAIACEDGCVPKVAKQTEPQTCESCRHWKFIAKEFQCETTKCQGYEPQTEPQTEYKKWDTPPKVELPTEITTCISVLPFALGPSHKWTERTNNDSR